MNKIISKWYIYLSLILVSTVTFCIAVNAKTAPKEDERVSFFVGSPDYKKEELENKLNSNREDEINKNLGTEIKNTVTNAIEREVAERQDAINALSENIYKYIEDSNKYSTSKCVLRLTWKDMYSII